MTRADLHHLLYLLADRLTTAISAEPFDPMIGYWVATDLVTAGFDAPEALGRSLSILDSWLPAKAEVDSGQAHRRGRELVQQFATGFARALRDQTLDGQEQIRTAALTTRVRAEQALRHAALHDAITGLPNQILFLRQLRSRCTDPTPGIRFGICHIGVDGLDAAKTSLGPSNGDRLLRMAADRLRAFAADSGHLTARWSDDQFVLLVQDTSCVDDVAKVADRVLSRLAAPYHLGDLDLPVGATAGIVEVLAADADPIEVMRAADQARHWAAADSTGWAEFDHVRGADDLERYQLTAALPAAIRQREITLRYQPIVELRTGTVAGLEALARWHHPALGTVPPQRFITLAEDTGLIVPLGRQLLERACHDAANWHRQTGHPPYVSVNIAVTQLLQPGLTADIAAILDQSGLPPHLLQLEITETILIDYDTDKAAIDALRTIADLGIRLVIDDFGTGYCNLAYLPTLPLHGLKLARTFLTGHPSHSPPPDNQFLTDLVSLGHSLGLTVTGEGVETQAHARRLQDAGGDTGQGWYLGHAQSARHVPALIARARMKLIR